jgi:hypothetical protein
MRMERYYESQLTDDYYRHNDNGCQEGEGEQEDEGCDRGSQDGANSADRQIEYLMQLASISSNSMTFVALYTMAMAVALSLFGSTAIVGFTSLRGDYIAPCFSTTGSSKLRLGIFGGAIVIFANLLLVCAVVFGEVRVSTVQLGSLSFNPNVGQRLHLANLLYTLPNRLRTGHKREARRTRRARSPMKLSGYLPSLLLHACFWRAYTLCFRCCYFYTLEMKKSMRTH